MSEDNITTPGNEPHQLQAPGPGFDCAVIIEQVIEQTSAKHANTMATIANLMENQQQQMNKITCILAGISQFLVQGNLRQNNPNNGVPPSTSQQHYLGQNTPETRRATTLYLGFCSIQVKSRWYQARLLKVEF